MWIDCCVIAENSKLSRQCDYPELAIMNGQDSVADHSVLSDRVLVLSSRLYRLELLPLPAQYGLHCNAIASLPPHQRANGALHLRHNRMEGKCIKKWLRCRCVIIVPECVLQGRQTCQILPVAPVAQLMEELRRITKFFECDSELVATLRIQMAKMSTSL